MPRPCWRHPVSFGGRRAAVVRPGIFGAGFAGARTAHRTASSMLKAQKKPDLYPLGNSVSLSHRRMGPTARTPGI